MKLDYKKTIFVGIIFFSISLFWQMYDNIIAKILDNEFGYSNSVRGIIMALDNIVALFMLPLFGHLSDKTKSRFGKRTPYIICGTILAATTFIFVGVSADSHSIVGFLITLAFVLIFMSVYRSPAVALMPDVTVKPLRSKANAIINLMGALGGLISLGLIAFLIKDGGKYLPIFAVVSAIMLLALLIFLLFVKENKLSSKMLEEEALLPNAETNITTDSSIDNIPYSKNIENETDNIETKTDKPEDKTENLSLDNIETKTENLSLDNIETKTDKDIKVATLSKHKGNLSKPQVKSMLFLLASVLLWYMAYNAVTSSFSVYAQKVWNIQDGKFTLPLMVAQVAAIAMFIPVGLLASKIGRKKTILIGIVGMFIAFLAAFIIGSNLFGIKVDLSGNVFSEPIFYLMAIFFMICGAGWATINVNSYPMVVEMAKGDMVGKYTGYYYTASMAGQIITPFISGWFMDLFSMKILFLYATVFIVLAFITMSMVKHGDNKPLLKKTALEHFENLD